MVALNEVKASVDSSALIESDYGSDIDDDTWDSVLVQAESNPLVEVQIEDLQDVDITEHDPKPSLASLRLPRGLTGSPKISAEFEDSASVQGRTAPGHQTTVNGTRTPSDPVLQRENDAQVEKTSVDADENDDDSKSPLQRFRSPPKKTLSVTDFVSPAWCELQYWYSLIRYGRVKRTPAMKAGSKVHKEKEREVHIEVPIEVQTREDKMGLRMWNIIQGLRTLRSTGLTRELELFGVIEGEVVVGIVDEINSVCPDEDIEAVLLKTAQDGEAPKSKKGKRKSEEIPVDQRSMKEFFQASQARDHRHGDDTSSPQTLPSEGRTTYYLVDIKTRGVKNVPHQRQMKPTMIQLMMYHRMLSDLAANRVDAQTVLQRYRLDPAISFSDTFIAELANLDMGVSQASADEGPPKDSLDEIVSHSTLSSLWTLMIEEFGRTIPTQRSQSVISPLLTAEYRTSSHGELIGRKSFGFDADKLQAHTKETLEWWRGERPARGVEIEEAWKCGICEFADRCTWRAEKIEEATQKSRARRSLKANDRRETHEVTET